MKNTPRPRSPSAARFFVLLALAFAFGQVGPLLHLATHTHEFCQEHGALVHSDESTCGHGHTHAHSPLNSTPGDDSATSGDGRPARVANSPDHATPVSAHEHCPFLSPGQILADATTVETPIATTSLARPIVAQPDDKSEDSISLLLLAPKQSPPIYFL